MRLRIIRLSGPPGLAAGPTDGERVIGRETLVIGRAADCDWVLPDPERLLSKRHCEVAFQGTVFVLRDTSTNGVFLNRSAQPLGFGKTAVLRHGDRFHAAGHDFRVEMLGDGAGDRSPAARPFVDPGSPLDGPGAPGAADPWRLGAGEPSRRDAFAPAAAGGLDPLGDAGTFGTDWGQDPPGLSGDHGFVVGPGPDGPGIGFGAFDLPAAGAGAAPAIPEEFDFGALTAPPVPDPWQGQDTAGPASPGPELADMAAGMIEALMQLDRQLTAIGQRLGLPRAADTPADRLPPASGGGLIDALTRMPAGAGPAVVRELGSALTARCEVILQLLDAMPAPPPEPPAPISPARPPHRPPHSLEDDPFE